MVKNNLILVGKMIKRVGYIILGAVLGGLVSYVGAWLLGSLFGPLYTGEDDMSRNIKIYLGVTVLLLIAGGILGNKFYRQS